MKVLVELLGYYIFYYCDPSNDAVNLAKFLRPEWVCVE